jgi:hypothetical protein
MRGPGFRATLTNRLNQETSVTHISTCLWFDNQAAEAAAF